MVWFRRDSRDYDLVLEEIGDFHGGERRRAVVVRVEIFNNGVLRFSLRIFCGLLGGDLPWRF